jgi:DNA-directed RNA polymerase beta' subunit
MTPSLMILTHHTPVYTVELHLKLRPIPPNFDPYDHLLTVSRILNEQIVANNRLLKIIEQQNNAIVDIQMRLLDLELNTLIEKTPHDN